jgi:TRAP-type mannitol/chloroaromatic compound transport system permease small subunit
MEIAKKYIRAVSTINECLGRIDAFVIIPLVLITIYEVIRRKIFGSPTIWVFEMSNTCFGLLFTLGLGYALLHGKHVNIDIFYRYLSERGKAILDIVMFIVFFFPFVIIILWQAILFAATSWVILETSQSVFRMPLYPIKTAIPLMALTLLAQGIAVFIEKIYFVSEGKKLEV